MPVDEAPDDDAVRQTYNFPPGAFGLVYRADGPDHGSTNAGGEQGHQNKHDDQDGEPNFNKDKDTSAKEGHDATKYKLQAMKWGMELL